MAKLLEKYSVYQLMAVALLCLTVLFGWYTHTFSFSMDLVIAGSGFSIIEVLQSLANPGGFALDYPGGARLTTAKSLTTYIYIFGQEYLHLAPMTMLHGMILLEIATLIWGAWLFWNSVIERSVGEDKLPNNLKAIAFVWIAILLTLSNMQFANMSYFGFPFFHGQFYGFADGLRLAGLAMVIRRKWIMTALLFALAFTIHPIKAVLGMVFAVPFVAMEWRKLLNWRFVLAGILGLGVCAVWYVSKLQHSGTSVSLDDFVAYTLPLQQHWYPVDFGLFGDRHQRGFSPFSAVCLVSLIALTQNGWEPRLRTKFFIGLAILGILTAIGIYASVEQQSAALIRIALHRASNLFTLMAPIIIVYGALLAWLNRRYLVAAGLLGFMMPSFDPMGGPVGLSTAFAVVLAIVHFIQARRIYLVIVAAILVVIGSTIYFETIRPPMALNNAILPSQISAVIWLIFWLASFVKSNDRANPLSFLIVAAMMIYGGWNYGEGRVTSVQRQAPLNQAYLNTQFWAAKNTKKDALFMVDPCRWYGWRDFSGRASLGTVREWFMTAWIYLDNAQALEKGKAISYTLGFDMEPFRNTRNTTVAICKAARTAYYDPKFTGLKKIKQKYHVDYFVFEKAYAGELIDKIKSRASYQNEHFAILSSDAIQ